MKRTIKFRGRTGRLWRKGDLLHTDTGDLLIRSNYVSVSVESETVGQFTGQYDKNGSEIYEGDILRFYDEDIPFNVVVLWKGTGLKVVYTRKQHVSCSWPVGEMNIIGNIHDNPELLKGGAE